MAQQESIIKLKGTVGDLSFYKTRNGGYQVRQKAGVDGDRIAKDPNFQRTRENCAEFGRAGKAGKLFRTVFKTLTEANADSSVSNRLTKLMVQIVKADGTNVRGERMVLDAETEMLKGFEFNLKGEVGKTLYMPYVCSFDRGSGSGLIDFPSFSASNLVVHPQGATHFKLIACMAVVDFEGSNYSVDLQESALMGVNDFQIPAMQLNCSLGIGLIKPLFLLLGVSFYQQVNGFNYPLNNGIYNGLMVAGVQGL